MPALLIITVVIVLVSLALSPSLSLFLLFISVFLSCLVLSCQTRVMTWLCLACTIRSVCTMRSLFDLRLRACCLVRLHAFRQPCVHTHTHAWLLAYLLASILSGSIVALDWPIIRRWRACTVLLSRWRLGHFMRQQGVRNVMQFSLQNPTLTPCFYKLVLDRCLSLLVRSSLAFYFSLR